MIRTIFICVLLAGVSSCGKRVPAASGKRDSPVAAKDSAGESGGLLPEQAARIESQFLPPVTPGKSGAAIEDRLNGAVHAQLTAQLRIFKTVKGRMPENFYELANTVGDSVPRLPDGMKFMIDPVDQTVKAVRK